MKPGSFRLRKVSSVEQEHAIYEFVDEEQNILMDVTKTDDGVFQACIVDNQGQGRSIDLDALLALIEDARQRIDADE